MSINFNPAATSALRVLQSTNSALDATQSRIATGLRIAEAKDNAAYWSISTSLKSDNKSLSTVQDALSLGAGAVDVAYQGLNSALDVLNEIKAKLTAASNPAADRTAIQAELNQLQSQLRSYVNASTFGGENWLIDQPVVATPPATPPASPESPPASPASPPASPASPPASPASPESPPASPASPPASPESPPASPASPPASPESPPASPASPPASPESPPASPASPPASPASPPAPVLKQVVSGFTKDSAGVITLSTIDIDINAANMTGTGGKLVDTLAISIAAGDDQAAITADLNIVETAIRDVKTAAANFGAVASRIELQKTFVDKLSDTIDKGISNLIDADMNEESTRLQALQVKQQLGVQALSIANQSAQNVLRLFQ